MDEVKTMGDHGIAYGAPKIDLDKLRGFKDGVVKKLTGGLAGMAKARKVEVVRGIGRFLDPHHMQVELTSGDGQATTGAKKAIKFQKAIIAAGSQAVKLPFMPDDPRVVDSTGALLLTSRFRSGCWWSAAASSASKWRPCIRRSALADRRRRNARHRDGRRRPRPRQGVGEEERGALRQRDAEDEDDRRQGDRRPASRSRSKGEKAPPETAGLRPGARRRRPQRQRQEDRRGQGRRRRHRPWLRHRSTSRCAPTSRTSTRSATSSASRCSRTRRCTRRTSQPRPPPDRSLSSMRGRFRRSPTPIPRSRGPASPRTQCKAQGIKYGKAVFPWAASGPRDRQRPRRRLHQADLRRGDAPLHRRRHRRHARRRPDRRSLPRRRDGLRSVRHRQDHPSASDAGRIDRHGGRSCSKACAPTCRRSRRNRRNDHDLAEEQLRTDALEYHEFPRPGKISIAPTKALANQRDLSLAYSPGVAYACTAIQHDPTLAAKLHGARQPGGGRSPTARRCSASATSARSPASR